MSNCNCNNPNCHTPARCVPVCCVPCPPCPPCPSCPPCPPCPPEPVSYSILYEPNGGTGGAADYPLPQGLSYTIKNPEQVNVYWQGHIFTGWNTAPGGSGIFYRPEEIITVTQNLTLYAQWIVEPPQTASVIYAPNGGIGGLTVSGIPVGSNYTLRSAADINMSWPGYSFIGWNTQPDGSGTFYQPGDVVFITQDQTFYAIWQRNVLQRQIMNSQAAKPL